MEFAGGCLVLGPRRVPLLCGAVHYFRLSPTDWSAALSGVKDLGLHFVDIYVPWSVHRAEDGRLDFGDTDPCLDLPRFLRLASDQGLLVYLRPGPHINAELTHFGLPSSVLDDEACQARTAAGNPVPFVAPPHCFAVPSYGSRAFLAATARWYRSVAKVVKPFLWPAGPVVLVQVDNEAAFYFRDGPYDQDYHPDSIAAYRALLDRKYGGLAGLNRAYGGGVASWREVEPPRSFDGRTREALRRQLDWAESREMLLADSLAEMRRALTDAGLGRLKTLHNLPMGDGGTPASLGRLQHVVDLVGADFYEGRHQLPMVRRRALRLAGSSELPFAPEIGVGGPPWFAPRSRNDTMAVLLCCLAYGVRGFNLYMAVDRDRWYGAALSEGGTRTDTGYVLRSLLKTLARVEFHRLQRPASVGLMVPHEYARLGRATHALGFVSPCVLEMLGIAATSACRQDRLGFARPVQLDFTDWLANAEALLDASRIPFVYLDSACHPSTWQDLAVVMTPCYEFADRARTADLERFVEGGGTVLWGPFHPELDQNLSPTEHPRLSAADRFDLSASPADRDRARTVLAQRTDLARSWPIERTGPAAGADSEALPLVQTSVHVDEQGPRALFVTNFGARREHVSVHVEVPAVFTDAVNGEQFKVEDRLAVSVREHACRMFVIERPDMGSPVELQP
ncbi:MAG: beta-galactosidase [Myxococcales bacterium]|nr:beta-galactosidase [Myxococcales bacterium]